MKHAVKVRPVEWSATCSCGWGFENVRSKDELTARTKAHRKTPDLNTAKGGEMTHAAEDWGHADCEVCNEARKNLKTRLAAAELVVEAAREFVATGVGYFALEKAVKAYEETDPPDARTGVEK